MNLSKFQHEISQAGKPVVVDFWAPWCAPCRVTKPALEKVAREYSGKVVFLPVNADESGEILERFQIAGIPTVLAIRGVLLAVLGLFTGSLLLAVIGGLVAFWGVYDRCLIWAVLKRRLRRA